MKIGILGGSFDPVHNGHIEMACFCKQKFNLDKIMFLPLGEPPHKKNITDKELRIKMLQVAIENYEDFFVSRLEVDRPGKTYTYETIKCLLEKCDDDFYYIIGGDTINTLETWFNVYELFKILKFIVVDRCNYNRDNVDKLIKSGAKLYFADHVGQNVSSTAIRNNVKKGENIDNLVPEKVKELILQNELYKN
ncbi:MAG: nicotinate (nicotinamide) nucleotide adenylyltransferase [Clostridiales bacterium]|nr:nicotinate (nicotinamide) nucleotide adenylyltransferase [Clostridiales bacterium]